MLRNKLSKFPGGKVNKKNLVEIEFILNIQ